MAFSLLRLRPASAASHKLRLCRTLPLYTTKTFAPFSASPLPHLDQQDVSYQPPPPPPPADPKPTLSARMSFVFDQIDAIHRCRADKDEALQRIRAWRHSKQQQQQQQEQSQTQQELGDVSSEASEEVTSMLERDGGVVEEEDVGSLFKKEVELVHPWPEWIELMERLLQQNYFDHRRLNEDRMLENTPVDLSGISENDAGFDFSRDWISVCNAFRNFGHDRFDILKSLSRKDIQVLVGHGCPSTDGKLVYSAKLLRKLAHVNEGDVCSACSLRSSCKKGFLIVPKEDEARTLDVMRVLLTFGFDAINGSVKNKPLMKMKSVKTIVRKLLHEIVKLSAVPINPNLQRPVIKKPPSKVKQTPPPPKKRVGRDDVEMKKGDWLCPKCDFMNFAKNAVCLQCDSKRPKRQLLPGEWECPECNFLNYRRNMACFHCECKRPPDEFVDNQINEKQHETRTRPPRDARMTNVSDAWNFDFDENESDGADVAAFEFADPPRLGDESSLDGPSHEESARGFDYDLDHEKMPRIHERRRYICESDDRNPHSQGSRTGFDDFEDEEDSVDSYEIDMSNYGQRPLVSRKNFSDFESASESEEFDNFDHHSKRNPGVKASFSDSDDGTQNSDSDGDLSNRPKQKSSQYRGLSYGSDDDMGRDFSSRSRRESRQGPDKNGIMRRDRSSERISRRNSFEDNDNWPSRNTERNGRGSHPDGFHDSRRNSREGDFRRSNRPLRGEGFEYGPRRNNQASGANGFGGRRGDNRGSASRGFDRPLKGERFEFSQNRSNQFNDRSRSDDRPGRRIIER